MRVKVAPREASSRLRRVRRYVIRRSAIGVALITLFYATSLHGLSTRTLVLAALLLLGLYWLFKRHL